MSSARARRTSPASCPRCVSAFPTSPRPPVRRTTKRGITCWRASRRSCSTPPPPIRSSSCSMTSTGPTRRRCGCCATWPGGFRRAGCWSSAPTGKSRSPGAIPSPMPSASCDANGGSSTSCSAGYRPRRSTSSSRPWRNGGSTRRRNRCRRRCGRRPRGIRSSWKRSCGTSSRRAVPTGKRASGSSIRVRSTDSRSRRGSGRS